MKVKSIKLNGITRVIVVTMFSAALSSCGDDGDENPLGLPVKDNGFFIVNEGAFGNSNTSLSFYSLKTGKVTNNIFQLVNGRPLGDQSQSMYIDKDRGFIVVQNSGKIEVINVDNFESIATITNEIISPRYFIGLNKDKGYVSDWGADGLTGTVKVIDLDTYTVTKTISTGTGSNEMVIREDFLYVANAGGFATDNTIAVIDTRTDEVIEAIEVGVNPSNLEVDEEDNIWVLGKGHLAFDTDFNLIIEESSPGFVGRLNPDNTIEAIYELREITFSTADDLAISESGDHLYFNYNGGAWDFNTESMTLSAGPVINQKLYGLSVDPSTGNLIGTEAPDFTSAGNLIFYDANGSVLNSFSVGIGPNSCIFKK